MVQFEDVVALFEGVVALLDVLELCWLRLEVWWWLVSTTVNWVAQYVWVNIKWDYCT